MGGEASSPNVIMSMQIRCPGRRIDDNSRWGTYPVPERKKAGNPFSGPTRAQWAEEDKLRPKTPENI